MSVVLLCFQVASGSQPAGLEALADRFVRAWTRHDIHAFGSLFTDDTYWVTASAVKVRGGTAIQAWLQKEHSGWAKATTMTARNTSVRHLSTDTAVVLLEWEIAGLMDSQGQPAAPASGISLFVAARRSGEWRIIAGQVTSGRAAR